MIVKDLMSKIFSIIACLNFDYYNAISHDFHETEIPALSSPRIPNRLSVAIHDCIDIVTVLLSSYGIFTAALNFEYLTACYVFRIVEIKKSVKIVRHYSNDK